jgi:hypothetical protein
VPLLTRPGVIEGVGLCRWLVVRPADGPGDLFDTLAAALVRPQALPELMADGTSPAEIARLPHSDPRAVAPLLKGALSQAAARLNATEDVRQPGARLLLVIDQLEDIFTLDAISADDRVRFAEVLGELAGNPRSRTWVVATLRSDLAFVAVPGLAALKQGAGQDDLQPPTPAEIGQIIRRLRPDWDSRRSRTERGWMMCCAMRRPGIPRCCPCWSSRWTSCIGNWLEAGG